MAEPKSYEQGEACYDYAQQEYAGEYHDFPLLPRFNTFYDSTYEEREHYG